MDVRFLSSSVFLFVSICLFLCGLISAHTLFCLWFFYADAVHSTLVSCYDIMLSFIVVFNTLVHSYVVPLTLYVLRQSVSFK